MRKYETCLKNASAFSCDSGADKFHIITFKFHKNYGQILNNKGKTLRCEISSYISIKQGWITFQEGGPDPLDLLAKENLQ